MLDRFNVGRATRGGCRRLSIFTTWRLWAACAVAAAALAVPAFALAGGQVSRGGASAAPHGKVIRHRLPKPTPRPAYPAFTPAKVRNGSNGSRAARPHALGKAPRFAAGAASVTTFTVDSNVDSPLDTPADTSCVDSEGAPACSLRAAVQAANNLGTPVQINLPADTYNLDDQTNGVLVITNPGGTAIAGQGATAADTTIAVTSGSDSVLAVNVNSSNTGGNLWLSNATLTGGSGETTQSNPGTGGGLVVEAPNASAVLYGVTITANSARDGGGVGCDGASSGGGGSVWINNSSITGNMASSGGGGVFTYWCAISVINSKIEDNTASNNSGGGLINAYSTVSVTGGDINDNLAGVDGSTIGYGGGIYDEYAVTTLNGVAVNGNTAFDGGNGGGDYEFVGELTASDGSFNSNNAPGTDAAGGGLFSYGAVVTLHHEQVESNTTGEDLNYCEYGGSGIYSESYYGYAASLTIDRNSYITNNQPAGGISIYAYYGGAKTRISDSAISRNSSDDSYTAGGVCNYSAYYSNSSLDLINDRINRNTDSGNSSAGGVMNETDYYAAAELTIRGGTMNLDTDSDTSGDSAGAVFNWAYEYATADATINNAKVTNGSGPDAGAIFDYEEYYGGANVTLNGDTVSGNSATKPAWVGAIAAYAYEYGGATVTASKTTFSQNNAGAGGEGGAIQLLSGDDYSPVEGVFDGDTFTSNTAGTTDPGGAGQGGAIWTNYQTSLSVTGTKFFDNHAFAPSNAAAQGGAIYSYDYDAYQSAAYESDRFVGNSAVGGDSAGGAVYTSDQYGDSFIHSTFAGNSAEYGGAIATSPSAAVTLALDRSTFAGNTAVSNENNGSGLGGALFLPYAKATATNSTFSGNQAQGVGGSGGAIYDASPAALTLDFSTIARNYAANGAGIADAGAGGTTRGSIISQNLTEPPPRSKGHLDGSTEADCAYLGPGSALGSANNNVLGQDACVSALASSDVVSTSPGLGALSNNGGNIQTMPLLNGSPAIGNGGNVCPAVDERGVTRPTPCDSGAYEYTTSTPR